MPFSHAIVCPPSPAFVNGLATANLGTPIYEKAMMQHLAYVEAMLACGLNVEVLDADSRFPDSTFVEDAALLYGDMAVLTRPGAPSRQGEIESMERALRRHFVHIERIIAPGTVDAGDIMMVDEHFFIGLSARTNADGAKQVIAILNAHGMSGAVVNVQAGLHLKSSVAYLANGVMVATTEFARRPEFSQFQKVTVPNSEEYAANCLWLNDTVLIAQGYPETKSAIEAAGFDTIVLDVSEFRKLDGGLSCLSLRF